MKQKRGILYWLRVVLAAASVMFLVYRCSQDFSIPAAADSDWVQLSVEQTIALYGTQLNALYTDPSNGTQYSLTFELAGSLRQFGYMDKGGGFAGDSLISLMDSSYTNAEKYFYRDMLNNLNGLVYEVSASQWNSVIGHAVDGYSWNYNQTLPVQLHMPFSLHISGISHIRQMIMYPEKLPAMYNIYYNNPSQDILKLGVRDNGVDIVDWWEFTAIKGLTSYGHVNAFQASMPMYEYDSGSVDQNRVQKFAGWIYDFEIPIGEMDVEGQTIDCYCVGSTLKAMDIGAGYYINDPTLYLIIGCPLVDREPTPPAATTTGLVTHSVETMPPQWTDTPENIINQNLTQNIYQLDLILGQLNLIYAKLVANGELGLDVNIPWDPEHQNGEAVSVYGTDIKQQIDSIINGHTTAVIPGTDVFNPDYVSSGFNFLWDIPWIAMLGGLSLAVSVAAWIIFEGRGVP